MTTNDPNPHPPGEPEEIGQLFADDFDLIDAEVDAIDDAHIIDRLQQVLRNTGYAERVHISGIGVDMGRSADVELTELIKGVGLAHEVEQATCALLAVQREAAQAEARVRAARREADDLHAAAAHAAQEADQARKHAADVRAGADAYVDTALDRAADILADAQARAAQIIADAERQAEQITTTAREAIKYVTVSPQCDAMPRADLRSGVFIVGAAGAGKSTVAMQLLHPAGENAGRRLYVDQDPVVESAPGNLAACDRPGLWVWDNLGVWDDLAPNDPADSPPTPGTVRLRSAQEVVFSRLYVAGIRPGDVVEHDATPEILSAPARDLELACRSLYNVTVFNRTAFLFCNVRLDIEELAAVDGVFTDAEDRFARFWCDQERFLRLWQAGQAASISLFAHTDRDQPASCDDDDVNTTIAPTAVAVIIDPNEEGSSSPSRTTKCAHGSQIGAPRLALGSADHHG